MALTKRRRMVRRTARRGQHSCAHTMYTCNDITHIQTFVKKKRKYRIDPTEDNVCVDRGIERGK